MIIAMGIGLQEIYISERIGFWGKVFWTIIFFALYYPGLLLYYFIDRKSVLGQQQADIGEQLYHPESIAPDASPTISAIL